MNVSIKNNVIWLCPERTGGRILREIFKNYDFFSYERRNNYELKSLNNVQASTESKIPENYKNFKVISGLRNPYDRIWSCYINFYTKRYRPKEFDLTKQKFNDWVNKSFKYTTKGVETDSFYEGQDYFNKWKFDLIEPNSFLRIENLQNDVMSLDFIKKQPLLFDVSIFLSRRFKNERFLNFNSMYEKDTAKKVFNFYKKHFFVYGYDPFSFTTGILTDEDKIDFLHTYNGIN